MPEFDYDSPLSDQTEAEVRVAWMNANCERQEGRAWRDEEGYWELPHASYSDYGGSTCDKANVRSFEAEFKGVVSVIKGGYSSASAVIHFDAITDISEEDFERLKDVIDGLENYPIIDEQMLSEVEMEEEDEAWEGWVKSDFLKELNKYFEEEIQEYLATHPKHDDFNERLEHEVYSIFRLGEPEWNHETGGASVNLDRVLRHIDFSGVIKELYPEDTRQLKFDLQGMAEALLEAQSSYSYSSTQFNLPEELAAHLAEWGKVQIAEEDLYVDEKGELGRETELHVTVKYGLTDAEPSPELREIVAGTEPFTIRLGRVSLFTTNEDYDVVKLEVQSPELRELNRQVSEACPNEDKYPSYAPHATICYVKKGRGAQFEGASPWEDPEKPGSAEAEAGEFTADTLLFSPSSGEDRVPLTLGGSDA